MNWLVGFVLVTQAWIGLEASVPVGRHALNAPVADWGGVLLIGALFVRRERVPLPAWPAWAAFLAVGGISAFALQADLANETTADSLHWLVRKPLFFYIAYLIALPAAIQRLPQATVERWLQVAIAVTAAISVETSLQRIAMGSGLWWAGIGGLTSNHKTFAVWLAPFFPWLWSARNRTGGRIVAGLAGAALLLAVSKTAWLTALIGMFLTIRWRDRPLVAHPLALGGIGLAALFVATSPWWVGSVALQDAFDSRRSLDLRAWTMFTTSPWWGIGPGSATTFEMSVAPHWRINGVDAHGVIQKISGELGLFGLFAWLGFTALLCRSAAAAVRRDPTRAVWLWVLIALHINLLASTEAFSMTHWIPLGIAWAGLQRETPCAS